MPGSSQGFPGSFRQLPGSFRELPGKQKRIMRSVSRELRCAKYHTEYNCKIDELMAAALGPMMWPVQKQMTTTSHQHTVLQTHCFTICMVVYIQNNFSDSKFRRGQRPIQLHTIFPAQEFAGVNNLPAQAFGLISVAVPVCWRLVVLGFHTAFVAFLELTSLASSVASRARSSFETARSLRMWLG